MHETTAYERWEVPVVESVGPMTAEQLHGAYEEAFAEGREAGYQHGYAAGQEAAQADLGPKVKLFEALLDLLAEPVRQLDEAVEESLLALAFAVARQLVRRELKTEPGQVVAAVRQAMAALPLSSRNMRLYLHPEDVPLVREALSIDEGAGRWAIVDDPLLTRGGCRVESDSSRIDASVESRLAAVVADVLGGNREGDGSQEHT